MIFVILLLILVLAMLFGLLYLVLGSKPKPKKPGSKKSYTRIGKRNMGKSRGPKY